MVVSWLFKKSLSFKIQTEILTSEMISRICLTIIKVKAGGMGQQEEGADENLFDHELLLKMDGNNRIHLLLVYFWIFLNFSFERKKYMDLLFVN